MKQNSSISVLAAVNNILAQYQSFDTVLVEFPRENKRAYFSERQIRALQVLVAETYATKGQEAFEELVSNIIVHSGHTKQSERMIFRHDGCFVNKFEKGFLTTCSELTFKLLEI